MSDLWEIDGNLVESGGNLCEGDECPCDESTPGTVSCCFTNLLPACFTIALAGLTGAAGCDLTVCSTIWSRTWTLNWIEGCFWAAETVAAPGGCTANFRNLTLSILSVSPTNCQVTVLMNAGFGVEATYRATFNKSIDPPWTLTFISGSTCTNWPATITVNPC